MYSYLFLSTSQTAGSRVRLTFDLRSPAHSTKPRPSTTHQLKYLPDLNGQRLHAGGTVTNLIPEAVQLQQSQHHRKESGVLVNVTVCV